MSHHDTATRSLANTLASGVGEPVVEATETPLSGDKPITQKAAPDVSVRLPHDLSAPRMARQIVSALVAEETTPESVFNAKLGASELVSNAVTHGTEPTLLRAWLQSGRLRIEVTDAASECSPFFVPTGDVGGRGLELVADIAEAWGIEFHPADNTKTVWFELEPRSGLSPCSR